MKQVSKLKISEFLSVSTQLAMKAAHIINDVFTSNDLQQQMKAEDDPFTIADVKAQTLIIKGLKSIWPTLNIIGEESQVYDGELNIDFLNPKLFPEGLFLKSRNNVEIETEIDINDDVVVWVDPLDGTLSYVNNELNAVTTLIGLSVGKDPYIGVIGKPYQDEIGADGKHIFSPQVYFGNTKQSKIFYVGGRDIENHKESVIPYELMRPSLLEKTQYTMCTSKNRMIQENVDKINSLQPGKLIKIGGAGKKTLMVLEGQSDFFIYIGKKTKRWDICAGDSLLRCFGGSIYGFDGTQYNYNPAEMLMFEEEYINEKGVLATLYGGNILEQYQFKSKGFL